MWRIVNAKKEAFFSAYLLITEIYTYWSYGDGIPYMAKLSSGKTLICGFHNCKYIPANYLNM